MPEAKKRHHYLPVFYLQEFVDPENEPYLWISDKEGGDLRPASPKDAGLEKHYHSFTRPDGSRDSSTLEDALAKAEGAVAPTWRKVVAREPLSNQERGDVSCFLSLLMTRVPSYRRSVEDLTTEVITKTACVAAGHKNFPEWVRQMAKEETGEELSLEEAKRIQERMLAKEPKITVNSEFSLPMISVQFAQIFHQMNWLFVVARGRYRFVTSDNPLTYVDPTPDPRSLYGVGLLMKNIEVTCPVSRDLALVAAWNPFAVQYQNGTERLIKEINLRTIAGATRFVYSSQRSEGLNTLVQRYRGSGPRVELR